MQIATPPERPNPPMRRALNPVARYNERVNRAKSANDLNLNKAILNPSKMPAFASPVPRSPAALCYVDSRTARVETTGSAR